MFETVPLYLILYHKSCVRPYLLLIMSPSTDSLRQVQVNLWSYTIHLHLHNTLQHPILDQTPEWSCSCRTWCIVSTDTDPG